MRTKLNPGTINRARSLRLKPTDAEWKLWYKLRTLNAQGYHFRRQAPFRAYILDFVEHSGKLVIELDGGQHASPEQSCKDAERDRILVAEGYLVLRFWNTDINENLEGIVDSIGRELQARAPAPHPTGSARRPPHEGEVKKRPLPRRGLRAPPQGKR